MANNVYDVSILTYNPDVVEPQLRLPVVSRTIKLAPSTTYPKGAWLGPVTATPNQFALYVHTNVDGSQVPEAILPRACVTDASGNIFEGGQASEEFVGVSHQTVPAYFSGAFKQTDLNSLDANTLADLRTVYPGARIISGSIAGANAIIQF